MRKEEFIKDIITKRGLSSQMNNTKWKELVDALNSDPSFNPDVNIKYLFDENNNGLYGPVWWFEFEQDGFEMIEWLEIRSFNEQKIGRLLDLKQTFYTKFIKNCLETIGVPYYIENDVFRVNAYL